MGLSYQIDHVRRVVLTRGWGTVTTDDVQDATSKLLADARFDPAYASLTDLRDVDLADVDPMIVAETASIPMYDARSRRAVVASTDAVYGMARMFASYAERAGQVVRVFRQLDEAELWLRLLPDPRGADGTIRA